jgi:hypothetical protein
MFPARNTAAAAGPPKRFVLCYGGVSVGGYSAPWDEVTPSGVGSGYEITRGLLPIKNFQIKSDVGIVSGLRIPWGPVGNVPPGGREERFHGSTKGAQVCGMSCLDRTRPDGGGEKARGPTADQIVAEIVGGGSQGRTLAYRVQAAGYYTGKPSGEDGRLSCDKDLRSMDPVVSPRLAYKSLLGDAALDLLSPGGPDLTLARRKSIVDMVRENSRRLLGRLGREDQLRLGQHFDEIRGLEERIKSFRSVVCTRPLQPVDPPIGSYQPPGLNGLVSGDIGWSNEEQRAEILCDLVALAFTCDLSRVASILFTSSQSFLSMGPVSGRFADMHSLGHAVALSPPGNTGDMADAVAWHVKHFARLAAKLRDAPLGGGGSILDHTAMVMLFEGGHGEDPEGDRDRLKLRQGLHSPHSSENMVAIVAGRAGGLKTGQHIKCGNQKHPAQVLISMMKAVGATGDSLGDVKGPVPELFKLG